MTILVSIAVGVALIAFRLLRGERFATAAVDYCALRSLWVSPRRRQFWLVGR